MNRYVIGNWKSNTTRDEALGLAKAVSKIDPGPVRVGIAPPTIWLGAVREAIGHSDLWLGAQSSSATGPGAFTGEVTAAMVAEVCDFVLVGHSERRALCGETDLVVRAKLDQALATPLAVVLCVGETIAERQAGDAETVIGRQLESALREIDPSHSNRLLIAYEPVWAIGTGVAATNDDAGIMARFVHDWTATHTGLNVPVLYGGSVNAANASPLIAEAGIDGFLVGGASLKPDEFFGIINAAIAG